MSVTGSAIPTLATVDRRHWEYIAGNGGEVRESIHPGATTGLAGREPLEGLVREESPSETEGQEDDPCLADAHEQDRDERGPNEKREESPRRNGLDEDDEESEDDEEHDESVQPRGREVREDRHPGADGPASG